MCWNVGSGSLIGETVCRNETIAAPSGCRCTTYVWWDCCPLWWWRWDMVVQTAQVEVEVNLKDQVCRFAVEEPVEACHFFSYSKSVATYKAKRNLSTGRYYGGHFVLYGSEGTNHTYKPYMGTHHTLTLRNQIGIHFDQHSSIFSLFWSSHKVLVQWNSEIVVVK